jgi:hypothetical protein
MSLTAPLRDRLRKFENLLDNKHMETNKLEQASTPDAENRGELRTSCGQAEPIAAIAAELEEAAEVYREGKGYTGRAVHKPDFWIALAESAVKRFQSPAPAAPSDTLEVDRLFLSLERMKESAQIVWLKTNVRTLARQRNEAWFERDDHAAHLRIAEERIKLADVERDEARRERDEAQASASTYREAYEAEQKASFDLRCHLIEITKVIGIHGDGTLPHHVVGKIHEFHADKADIETKWEELCKALGAHGPQSDPLTGSDTNDMIHARAMDWIKTMTSDEF